MHVCLVAQDRTVRIPEAITMTAANWAKMDTQLPDKVCDSLRAEFSGRVEWVQVRGVVIGDWSTANSAKRLRGTSGRDGEEGHGHDAKLFTCHATSSITCKL